MGNLERKIQSEIRLSIPQMGAVAFRANIGQAWTGSDVNRLPDGTVIIRNARPFNSGLPAGFSDLFGISNKGQFFAIEVKAPRGIVSDHQQHFLDFISAKGGLAGVARSVEDAKYILEGCGTLGRGTSAY